MGIVAAFDKVIYFNPSSKYTVMRVKTADLMIPNGAKSPFKYADHLIRFTAVGYDLPQSTALSMDLEGSWVDGKYGLQLQVERWVEVIPPTIEGIRAYLASGLLKGIGPKTADAIVQRFGTQSLRVIESHPEQLLEIRGITEEKLVEIKEGYAESKVLRDLMTILAPFKITPTTAMKIYQHFGPGGVALIRESPYRLCQMPTFGFKKVDAIVQKSGGNLYDPMRVQGALFYTLEQSRNEKGHLFLEADKLIQSSLLLLNESIPYPTQWIKPTQVQKELEMMVQSDVVVANQGKIYLPNVFKQESETAVQAVRMAVRPAQPMNVTSALERTKGKLGIVLSERQVEGVSKALRSNFSIITGGPGTGKSTVLRAVIEAYRPLYPNGKIALAAPTGKASRRMAETTGITDAVTLHSLLKLHGDDCGWQPSSPLDADLLIVDECSMVDMWLAHQLFSRLRQDTKLLMVGDADQLESVGAGSVFRELIASELVPVTVLDQIFRQAEGSLIAYNAKLINEAKGELYYGEDFSFHKADTQEDAAEVIRRLYRQNVERAGIDQVQILSPFRDTGDVSANRLNALIQAEINPASPDKPEISCGGKILRMNDRVMQTKNNYDAAQNDRNGNLIGTGVFNGDVGTIKAIESDSLTVDYDGRLVTYPIESVKELDLAYASTIHKAQGSEYDTVIIPLFAAHKVLLTRNLLYTAITRAKRRVALVGQKKALFMAIAKSSVGKRNTILSERMQRYYHALNTLRAEGMPAA